MAPAKARAKTNAVAAANSEQPKSAKSTPEKVPSLMRAAVARSPQKTKIVAEDKCMKLRVRMWNSDLFLVEFRHPGHPEKKSFYHHLYQHMEEKKTEWNLLMNPVELLAPNSTDLLHDSTTFYHRYFLFASMDDPTTTKIKAHLTKMKAWLNRNSKFNVMWMVPEDWDRTDDTMKLGAYLTAADMNQFLLNVYGEEHGNPAGFSSRVLPENWANDNPEELEKWFDMATLTDEFKALVDLNDG
jgi:hypothetical protein